MPRWSMCFILCESGSEWYARNRIFQMAASLAMSGRTGHLTFEMGRAVLITSWDVLLLKRRIFKYGFNEISF